MRGASGTLGIVVVLVLGALAGCGGPPLRPYSPSDELPGAADALALRDLPPLEIPPFESPPRTGAPTAAKRGRDVARTASQATVRHRLARHIARTYRVESRYASRIVDDAWRQASARHLRPTLLLAVIAQESSFRSDAVSSIGAVGLMQIRPELHDWRRDRLGLAGTLADPAVNIAVGADVLHECLRRHRGDVGLALNEYSGGASDYPLKVVRLELDFLRLSAG